MLTLSDGRKLVLRKQPPGKLLRGAHRVDREFAAMQALAASGGGVPVPKPHLLCDDASVIGTPFFVYDYVAGAIHKDPRMPGASPSERRTTYANMASALAALHALDWEDAGLSEYGQHSGYLARQIKVWSKQYEASRTEEDAPGMADLMGWLPGALSTVAAPDWTVLTHGDFRLDNMVLDPELGDVRAILDWELYVPASPTRPRFSPHRCLDRSTLGHPMADLAYNCMPYYLPPSRGPITGASRDRLPPTHTHTPPRRARLW